MQARLCCGDLAELLVGVVPYLQHFFAQGLGIGQFARLHQIIGGADGGTQLIELVLVGGHLLGIAGVYAFWSGLLGRLGGLLHLV